MFSNHNKSAAIALACLGLTGVGGCSSYSPYYCYPDYDGDGYGDDRGKYYAPYSSHDCDVDWTHFSGDCDDADSSIHPGQSEVCDDGLDNDCNGNRNDHKGSDWYADSDGDGYGDPDNSMQACDAPDGYVLVVDEDDDCDDSDGSVYPHAAEYCNEIDDDCDGSVDEDSAVDAAVWYADSDGDGFGDAATTTVACDRPEGYVANDSDSNDHDRAQDGDGEEGAMLPRDQGRLWFAPATPDLIVVADTCPA